MPLDKSLLRGLLKSAPRGEQKIKSREEDRKQRTKSVLKNCSQ